MTAFNSRVRGSEGDGSASDAKGEIEVGRAALRFGSPRVEGGAASGGGARSGFQRKKTVKAAF
jgi:hypothetical protein